MKENSELERFLTEVSKCSREIDEICFAIYDSEEEYRKKMLEIKEIADKLIKEFGGSTNVKLIAAKVALLGQIRLSALKTSKEIANNADVSRKSGRLIDFVIGQLDSFIVFFRGSFGDEMLDKYLEISQIKYLIEQQKKQ